MSGAGLEGPVLKKQRHTAPDPRVEADENTLLDGHHDDNDGMVDFYVDEDMMPWAVTCQVLPPNEEEDQVVKMDVNEEEAKTDETSELAAVATQARGGTEFDPFEFMACVPDRSHFGPQIREIERGTVLTVREAHDTRPTLVLDLDETLVHSSVMPIAGADFVFPVELQEGGGQFTVYAKKRPFCDQFLTAVAAKFEVVVFTASKRVYADRLLDLMGFRGARLFREHCVFFEGAFLKDLELLQRNLARTVIVDNSPHVFSLQVRNGIPIDSYLAAPHQHDDRELLGLLSLLEHLSSLDDVRGFLHRQFGLESRVARASPLRRHAAPK